MNKEEIIALRKLVQLSKILFHSSSKIILFSLFLLDQFFSLLVLNHLQLNNLVFLKLNQEPSPFVFCDCFGFRSTHFFKSTCEHNFFVRKYSIFLTKF